MPGRSLLAVAPVVDPWGAEITLLRLLRGLRARGWAVALTTPGPGGLRDAAAPDVEWRRLALGGMGRHQGARALASWPRARRLSAGRDIVYLNSRVCGRLLPALRGVRTVLHIHDLVDRVPRIWRRADVVLASSTAVARRLDGLSPHVVHPPVDPDPPDVAPPWEQDGRPVVGFVGRVEPDKGVLDLVRAAPAIRAASDARVVLVGGDGVGRDPAYSAAVRASGEVERYGWVAGGAGLMRHLDVLVLPSHRESAGTVLAEAMAVGTPVVATDVGGLPEVVLDGVTGRLVEPGSPAALAGAVAEVLERRDELGAAAARHARRFYVDAHVAAVEALMGA